VAGGQGGRKREKKVSKKCHWWEFVLEVNTAFVLQTSFCDILVERNDIVIKQKRKLLWTENEMRL